MSASLSLSLILISSRCLADSDFGLSAFIAALVLRCSTISSAYGGWVHAKCPRWLAGNCILHLINIDGE